MAYDRAMESLGLGTPGWPTPSTSWDWWPFVGISLALAVAHRSLRVPLRPTVLLLAVAFGPVFATLVHAWGAIEATAASLAVAWVISWRRNGRTGDDTPSSV
jgi:hypothetical protein